MNFLRIAWRDISSIFKNKFIRVSVTAIIIVPLLYSLLYLDAFWDPYSKLQNVGVAVVNLDQGAAKDGQQVSYGNDVVDKLKDNKEVGWKFVSQEDADKGLKGKKYYAEFIIPADFSEKVVSAKNGKPEQPKITYVSNDKKNFLASQIDKNVAAALKDEVSKTITKEYTKVTFDNLYDVKDGFKQAADGSKQLSDGIDTAKDGAGQLNDGLSQLNSSVPALTSGVSKLYQGSSVLYNGLASAASGSNQLNDGISQAQGKVSGAIGKFSSDSNVKYLLQPGVLDAAKTIINDGITIKDTDTSMLGLVNSQNIKMITDTANTANSVVNSEGVNEIVTTPSVQKLISELDMSKAQNVVALQTRVQAAAALMNDVAALETAPKVSGMLAPFSAIMNDPAKMQNAQKLASDANTLCAALSKINFNDINKMIAPFSPILGSDQATVTAINNANKLMTDTNALSETLSNSGSTISNFSTILNNAGSVTGLLNNAGTAVSQIKPDSSDVTMINNTDQATLEALNQNKAALIQLVQSSNLTDAQKQSIIAAVRIGTTVSPAIKNLLTMQQTLADPRTQALLGAVNSTLSPDSVNNINNMLTQANTVEADLNTNKPVLSVVQQSLTLQNASNLKQLLALESQAQTMQGDLYNNQEFLTAINSSMTPDNLKNVSALLTLAPKLDAMEDDLKNNADNLQLVSDMVTKVNDPKVQAVIPKLQQLQQEVATAKPLIQSLSTPAMMNKLSQSPALVGQLVSMQKDLQNNEKILEVTKNELSDNNVETAQSLINSIPQLTDGINQLSAGSSQLSTGLNQLYIGSGQLKNGLGELNGNVPALASGVTKLSNGSSDLYTGMNKLSTGATELKDKLKDGSDKINKNLINSSDDMATFISEPLSMIAAPINAIKNYGTGFTPYFIPLSLWVGAIMMFFVITDKIDDDIKASPASLVAGKFLSYGYIGFAQAALVSLVVLALGLRPHNILLYFLFNIFMSYVFIAIIQSLIYLLGDAGRLLAIVLLILQLTSDAGTFPLEVVPKFFKILNPIMPFTYCVEAMREVITATNYGVFFKDVAILAGYLFGFLIISMLMKGHADKAQRILEEKKIEAAATASAN